MVRLYLYLIILLNKKQKKNVSETLLVNKKSIKKMEPGVGFEPT
ncbi:protein of unknown function [Methanocaldococcus lauensis]|uniref:Uncharacterized protein n=1 Tax=Methanocaldococcus lauensis TaxID=2546128 RepID=A0A8D6SUW6_9EURY|nr:protein of unknown function [Methanocaldococcus lauensis]